MAEVGSLFVRLKADASQFQETMRGVSDRVSGTGRKMQSAGKGMTAGVTAPLVGIGAAAVSVGMGFDDQMAKVQAISGTTGENFENLRGTAMELGSSTRFSATEAAEGLEFLSLAGWDANEMASGLGGVLDLASASGMDLGRTSDIVTDTMSAFGIEAQNSGQVADMFATTSSNANTNVEQLGGALGKAGPILASMGIGLDETQSALGLMADQGLKGQRAGTMLGAVMRDLTANAEDGKTNFGEFSVELFDAEGNMRSFGDILGDVEGGLSGMSEEQRQAALSSVFQQQGLQGIMPLLSEGSGRYEELRSGIENSEGASRRMSETMEDTLAGSLRALKAQFEGIMIQLSDQLTPILRNTVIPLVQRLGDFLSKLIEWFSQLDPRIQTVIMVVVGLAAALGPVLIAVGTLMIVLAPLLPLLAALISPIGLIVAGIALLVAALITAYTQSETFRNIINTVVAFLRDVAVAAFDLIAARFREFANNVMPELIATWNTLKGAVQTAANFIWNSVIQPIFSAIQGFIQTHSETIKTVLMGAWEIIESGISTAVDVVEGIIIAFLALIRGDWERAWQAVKDVASSVWDHIQTVFGNVKTFVIEAFSTLTTTAWETVSGWVSDIKGAASDLFTSVTGSIGDLKTDVISFISDMASSAWGTVSGWVSDVTGAASDLFTDVTSSVSDMMTDVITFFSDMASDAWTEFTGMVTDVVTEAGSLATDVVTEVSGMVTDFVSEIVGLATDVISEFGGMATDVFTEVTGMVTDVMGEIRALPGKITGALPNAFGVLKTWGSNVVQGLIDGISGRIGDLAGKVGELRDLLPGSPAKWGPLRDATLRPENVFAGFADDLMGGFANRLDARMPRVEGSLANMNRNMSSLSGARLAADGVGTAPPEVHFHNPTIESKDNREPDAVLNDAAWASITALRRRGHR